MKQLALKAVEKWKRDGVLTLVRSVGAFVTERFPGKIAEYSVILLDRFDRIVEADEICHDEYQYGVEEDVTVDIAGGEPRSSLLDHVGERTSNAQSVRILNNVRLVGPYGIVITSEGEVVLDSSCGREYMLRKSIERTIRDRGLIGTFGLLIAGFTGVGVSRRRSDGERSISMLNPHANNYFHWTIEHLPRLRSTDVIDGDEAVEILIQRDAPQFVEESLRVLQYRNIAAWGDDVELIESLVVPDHRLRARNDEFTVSPSDLRWLRSTAIDAIGEEKPPDRSRRIYISRADADARNVTNREELLEAIRPLGFREYTLSELSIEEQIGVFRDADVIIGPHGAGLANMVYSDSAAIVELYGEDLTQGPYFMLVANELGHEYYSINCTTDGDDIVAPIDDVVNLLRTGL